MITRVAVELLHRAVVFRVGVGEPVGRRTIVGRVGEIGALGLNETRVQVGVGAVENPADAGDLVDQHASLAVAAIHVGVVVARLVVELEPVVLVLDAEIDVAHAHEDIVRAGHGVVDRGARRRAHAGDPVRVAGQDPSGARRAHGLRGKGARLVAAAKLLVVVVGECVERELRRR